MRVNIDYHVEVDRHYYSVPYQLRGEEVEARFTPTTVEIFYRDKRVASHIHSFVAYHHGTLHEHRPKSHQAYLEWSPSRLIHWGESVGPASAQVIRTILESKPHPEQFRRYAIVSSADQRAAMEKLEAARAANSPKTGSSGCTGIAHEGPVNG